MPDSSALKCGRFQRFWGLHQFASNAISQVVLQPATKYHRPPSSDFQSRWFLWFYAVKALASSIWPYPERHNCCLLWWFYMYRPLALTNSSWWVMLFVGEILYQLRYMKESLWFYTLPTTNSLPLRIVSKRKESSSKTIHFQGLSILVFLGEYSSTRLPTCHVHLVFLPRWRRKVAPLIFGILLDFFQISRCQKCALAFHQ